MEIPRREEEVKWERAEFKVGAVREKKDKTKWEGDVWGQTHNTENKLADMENRNEKSKQIAKKKRIKWLAKNT